MDRARALGAAALIVLGSLAGGPRASGEPAIPTAITVASPLPVAAAGQPVTLTVTVAPMAPTTGGPTGTVEFVDGPASLATVTLVAAGDGTATASLTVSFEAGLHPIVVRYGGDGRFAPGISAPPLQQQVRR